MIFVWDKLYKGGMIEMTRIVSLFIYYLLYSCMYCLPLLFVVYLLNMAGINVAYYIEKIEAVRLILFVLFWAYVFLLPAYRAKLASETYGERDMPFWEAHSISGEILKSQFGFLPIVGRFFSNSKA